MTSPPTEAVSRENAYLRQRVAQLESDIMDLNAQLTRLQQERERIHDRSRKPPDPLGGGR